MDPNGHYCDFYLNDLKIGYLMDEWFTNNMYNELTEEQKVRYDEAYEQIMDKVYGKDNTGI
jgi:aminoglycoside/choline kinase family phosphotransferase